MLLGLAQLLVALVTGSRVAVAGLITAPGWTTNGAAPGELTLGWTLSLRSKRW